MKKQKKYQQMVGCTNCRKGIGRDMAYIIEIPAGKSVAEMKCEKCGIKSLKPIVN